MEEALGLNFIRKGTWDSELGLELRRGTKEAASSGSSSSGPESLMLLACNLKLLNPKLPKPSALSPQPSALSPKP